MLVDTLTTLFEVDLKLAKRFVQQLEPKDLMMLGQQIMKGGFPFDACTELCKNRVELVFEVPVKYLDDGIQEEEEMGLDFGGIGEPPLVTSVNNDWKAAANQETGSDAAPEKGDRLAFVGGFPAKE